jgi:uncharacterized damage-inducible protein DinB
MSEIARMLDMLTRTYEKDTWHGPAVLEVLAGVDAMTATARPLASAHSILELTLHMAVWKNVVRRRLKGESWEPSPEENWSTVTGDPAANWTAALAALDASHRALAEAVAAFPEAALDRPPTPDGRRTAYLLIHGVIQHDLYHAGQIALLKKGIA